MDERERGSSRPRGERRRDIPQRSSSNAAPQYRNVPPRRRSVPPQGSAARNRYQQDPEVYADDEYEDGYDEEEEEYVERPRKRRRRPFWTAFFAGCITCIFCIVLAAAAIVFFSLRGSQGSSIGSLPGLGGPQTFTTTETQQISLSNIEQLQICDKIGNIKVTVDPQATQGSLAIKKTIQAASQKDANQLFQQMAVETQPPGTITHALACGRFQATPTSGTTTGNTGNPNSLTINVTIPNSNGMLPNANNAVDLTLVLPVSALSKNVSTTGVDVESSVGNIDLAGINGVLSIKGNTGNITINQSYLAPGSDIETGQGNITLNGRLLVPTAASNQQQTYIKLSSEKGIIDVTLPQDTNVILDSNTNSGQIKSDFAISVQKSGESASYHGPLNAGGANSQTTLVVDVSLGDIHLHQQTNQS